MELLNSSEFDFGDLARQLVTPVHEAGAQIMSFYGQAEVSLKADQTPVTEADKAADTILVAALGSIAPDIPIICEESSPEAVVDIDQPFFLVDPLDGTREFINNRTEFTVNVALIEKRRPTFGIVYAPALSVLYMTLKPGETVQAKMDPRIAFEGFEALETKVVSTRPVPEDGPTAAVSRSHLDDKTQAFLEARHISKTFASGSSLKFCCIADGTADVYPRFGRTMEWDTAAGHAVLVAAGGDVVCADGSPLLYAKQDDKYANPAFIAWGRNPDTT